MKTKKTKPKHRHVLFLTGWYSHPLHQGVVKYAHEANWILNNIMCYTGRIPSQWEGDGILCRHAFRKDIIDMCQKVSVPMVGWEEDERLPMPRVYMDQEKMGELAALHLLERGYRRLAFFHLGVAQFQLPRMEGFRRTAEKHGAKFFELRPSGDHQWPIPRTYDWSWLKAQLEEIGLPAGIMVTNDSQAHPLLNALEDMGISVPERVAVVGAENIELLCEMSVVPLSSVEANNREMGYQAAALLDRLMQGECAPGETLQIEPGPVVQRESSDMLSVENDYAAAALRFIWDHYRESISVEDVAGVVPVSRRRLQTLFRENVGRTIQEETNRVRLEAACTLLEKRELKVHEIASLCGFGSSLHMHRAFVGTFGLGPKAYVNKGRPADIPREPGPLR